MNISLDQWTIYLSSVFTSFQHHQPPVLLIRSSRFPGFPGFPVFGNLSILCSLEHLEQAFFVNFLTKSERPGSLLPWSSGWFELTGLQHLLQVEINVTTGSSWVQIVDGSHEVHNGWPGHLLLSLTNGVDDSLQDHIRVLGTAGSALGLGDIVRHLVSFS